MFDWKVEDYKDRTRRSRVREFIDTLKDARARKEAAALIKVLQVRGNQMRSPASDPLGGGLFELRGDQVRIFYCFRPGGRIFLIDGMIKKRDRIPSEVLARVRKIETEIPR
jgi:hypothetical protein